MERFVNMNAQEELNKLKGEIDEFCGPREKRIRELRVILEKEFIENQQKIYNDTVAGRLFYSDQQIWSGFVDTIYFVKPLSCDDWSHYNSCNVLMLEINLSKKTKKVTGFSIYEDTNRVDTFKTHYKELTPELFEQVRELVNEGTVNSFLNFKNVFNKLNNA